MQASSAESGSSSSRIRGCTTSGRASATRLALRRRAWLDSGARSRQLHLPSSASWYALAARIPPRLVFILRPETTLVSTPSCWGNKAHSS